jgi:hypothetical protein
MTATYNNTEIQRLAIENDPTILSEILYQYHGITEFLLETPDNAVAGISATLISDFRKTYGESALLCRYSPCPRASAGFSSARDRDKHECSHTRKFKCADSTWYKHRVSYFTLPVVKLRLLILLLTYSRYFPTQLDLLLSFTK